PSAIEIPKEGPLVYEFDVEVRPEFDLPNYRGLKLRRPVKEFSDDDVAKEEKSLLSRFAELIPKPGGVAQLGDYITADMTSKAGDRLIGELKAISMKVDTRLAFKDGVVENFADRVQGVKAGDTRTVDITMADSVADKTLRGQKVQATLTVKEVKAVKMP